MTTLAEHLARALNPVWVRCRIPSCGTIWVVGYLPDDMRRFRQSLRRAQRRGCPLCGDRAPSMAWQDNGVCLEDEVQEAA